MILREQDPPKKFQFQGQAGDFLRWQVWQEGVDIVIRLKTSKGRVLHEVDSPYGRHGPEDLVAILENFGEYWLEIEALKFEPGAESGTARPDIWLLRPATSEDRLWVETDRHFRSGRKLTSPEELTQGVQALHRALAGFTPLGLTRHKAETHDALALQHGRRRQLDLSIAHARQAALDFAAVDLPRREGLALQRQGVWQLAQGRTSLSVETLKRSLALLERVGNTYSAANVHSQLGHAYRRLGDLQTALVHIERAIDHMDGRADRITARAYHYQATALLTLNRLEQAADAYGTAASLYRSIGLAPTYEQAAKVGQANAIALAGRLDEALTIARDLETATSDSPADRTRAKILLTLGRIYRLRGDHEAAATALQQASELAQRLEDILEQGTVELELGYLELLESNYEGSLVRQNEALNHFRAIEERKGMASAQLRGAEALIGLHRPEEALERVHQALRSVEAIRTGAGQRNHRLAYFALRQDYFDLAISLLVRLSQDGTVSDRLIEALDTHEQSRARELLEARTQPSPERTPEQIAAIQSLKTQLAEKIAAPSFAHEEQERQEIQRLLERLEDVSSPASIEKVAAPIRSAEFRDRYLDAETLALIFAQVDNRILLWALDSQAGLRFATLELPELPENMPQSIASLAEGYRGAVRLSPPRQLRLGRQVSEAIFSLVSDLLPQRHRLVLILDGELEQLPFAALPSPQDPTRYLIEDHELVVLPSMTAMALLDRGSTESPKPSIAAFGDPVFSSRDPRVAEAEVDAKSDEHDLHQKTRDGGRAEDFSRLPNTRHEIENLARNLNDNDSLIALGFEASRDAFLAIDPEDHNMLHVATHAMVHPDVPELSGLIFSLVDIQGRARPGVVRAFEIRRSQLAFQLVNLSACSTGLGLQTPGEGILSLARAFLDAGSRRVVSSLWDVSDRATALLMTHFYNALLDEGLSAPAALRFAQLQLLANSETAAPGAWAPFIFQGDWRLESTRAIESSHLQESP